jgi:hypothetical protein
VRHGLGGPPQLLIYGITASDLNDNRLEPHGVRSLIDTGDLVEWLRDRPQSAAWAARHFAQSRLERAWQLYRYRNALRLWAADQVEQVFPGVCPQAAAEAQANRRCWAALRRGHGFAPHPAHQQRSFSEFQRHGVADAVPFGFLTHFRIGEHLACLHRLLQWADAAGVPLVLLDMPVTADLEERRFPEAFARYRTVLAGLERSGQVKVLRGSRQTVGLDDRDFADLIHLNARGTQRFSNWLRHALEACQ